jgi:Na+/proline symporter
MVAGFLVSQLWYLFLAPPVTPIYAFFPGVAASIIVTLVVSLFAKPLDAEFIAKLYP